MSHAPSPGCTLLDKCFCPESVSFSLLVSIVYLIIFDTRPRVVWSCNAPHIPVIKSSARDDAACFQRYSAMHKTVGGRCHFAEVSQSKSNFCVLVVLALPSLLLRPLDFALQQSPSLQISLDPAHASAWADIGHIVLLHSAEDTTVPASSSVRMHEALAGRGVCSRLLIGTGSHCSAIMGCGCVHADIGCSCGRVESGCPWNM